jgi:hypothetical protein
MEWLKVEALSSSPSTTKKKRKEIRNGCLDCFLNTMSEGTKAAAS